MALQRWYQFIISPKLLQHSHCFPSLLPALIFELEQRKKHKVMSSHLCRLLKLAPLEEKDKRLWNRTQAPYHGAYSPAFCGFLLPGQLHLAPHSPPSQWPSSITGTCRHSFPPQHLMFSLPGLPFSQLIVWLLSSQPSHTSPSTRPSLTTQYKVLYYLPTYPMTLIHVTLAFYCLITIWNDGLCCLSLEGRLPESHVQRLACVTSLMKEGCYPFLCFYSPSQHFADHWCID